MNTGKIIFFDIDGTIYREGHGISERTSEAIRRCSQMGHLLMLSTGRGASSIPDQIHQLPFDGGVFGCGTYVQIAGKVLVDAAVMGSRCQEIIDILYQNKCPFFVNNSDYIYYDPSYPPAGFDKIIRRMRLAYHGRLRPLSENPDRISKLTAYPQDNTLIPRIREELSPWFDVIDHPEYAYIEVILKGYTKGTGVQLALEETGIPKSQAYGFGDSSNDLPMLDVVGHGIIMKNAPEEIRGAYYLADSIQNDGVASALEELGLI